LRVNPLCRIKVYRGDKPPLDLQGKVAIFVDDGIDTGTSARAALLSIRKRFVPPPKERSSASSHRQAPSWLGHRHPSKLVLAVPVMPFARIGQFHGLVDDIVPLAAPRKFYAIGQYYRSVRRPAQCTTLMLFAVVALTGTLSV
jgi:putative phosphoribosyl transferase